MSQPAALRCRPAARRCGRGHSGPPSCWAKGGGRFELTRRAATRGWKIAATLPETDLRGHLASRSRAPRRLRWETNCGNGVVNVEFDRKDIEMNKIVATTLESRFRVFDARTLHPTEGFAFKEERAHKSTIWRARHLPQNRDLFATTGGNGGLNLSR